MIETIIKRNGQQEPFSPSKVNKWGEWAAKTLGNKVDWTTIVLNAVSALPKKCTSVELQNELIKQCLLEKTWSYNRMAGRLYIPTLYKQIFGGELPPVKDVHEKLIKLGFMTRLDYSDDEYKQVEKIINHKRDLSYAHYAIENMVKKYAVQDRTKGICYETPQFTYMRMAMALAENEPKAERMTHLAKWYKHLSENRINAPTPNYVNLGTPLNGYASCCLYTVGDNARSIGVGDHIAYTMTYMSAGIGAHHQIRSIGDPVRGGAIVHLGKLGYYRSLEASVKSNLQNGRGGAVTTYFNAYDPEIETLIKLKNPMSTKDKQIRGMDYNFGSNKFFARKVARNEDIFTFNCYTAPDLYNALYSPDEDQFAELYAKYESDPKFVKKYVSARELAIDVLNEGAETGRFYLHFIDEMNRHTPFKDPIYQSNLCAEIALPTKPYDNIEDLYSTEDHGRGEIALCSLGGVVVPNVSSDEEYYEVCYYTLKMIDICIHKSKYELPHLGITAKSRLNAGVGLIGVAHHMAKKGLKYSSQEGKEELHRLNERHAYMLIKASLQLGKELGNAPWMHKTKWPEGWLPIDTYNKNVDNIVSNNLEYDWETLRTEIINNGGIRNSSLVAHMPSETSSKTSGTCNGIYPVRGLSIKKSDKSVMVNWVAPESDKIGQNYELAWEVGDSNILDLYAITQKFTDQTISADEYLVLKEEESKIETTRLLKNYLQMVKNGIKTRYYVNSNTSSGVKLEAVKEEDDGGCASGGCKI